MATIRDEHAKAVEQVRERMPHLAKVRGASRRQVERVQLDRLRTCIEFARANSSFWRQRFMELPASRDVTFEAFEKVPPLTKAQVMENWASICTIPEMKSPDDIPPESILKFSTGGSSGVKGTFLWDQDTLVNSACGTYRDLAKLEADRSDKVRLVVISACDSPNGSPHASTPLFGAIQGAFSPDRIESMDFIKASTKQDLMRSDLERIHPTHIVSYGSVLGDLAFAALHGLLHLNPPPRYVMVNSEPLSKEGFEAAHKAWGVRVLNSLGCTEGSLYAISLGKQEDDPMVLTEDLVLFETPTLEERPLRELSPNELQKSDTFLITPLHSLSSPFPLFRYRVDDRVEFSRTVEPDSRLCITHVQGRSDDKFIYDDGTVSIQPITFRSVLGQATNLLEYQVKQTVDGAHLSLVKVRSELPLDTVALRSALASAMRDQGLKAPIISLKICDSIPRNQSSGKTTRFVKYRPALTESKINPPDSGSSSNSSTN